MSRSIISRTLLVAAVAACVVVSVPEEAFARGGGRGGGARSSVSRPIRRTGPARSGSTARSRARAADRRHASQLPATRPGVRPGTPNERRYHRWLRRRGGRRIAVADWGDLDCTKTERVDGVSYFYCDGTWWEKVYDGGEVYWVEVEKPE